MNKKTDEKINSNDVIQAVQVAFEFDQALATKIKILAAENGLSPSDQMRQLLGLSYGKPVRPRLTIRLSDEDYDQLSQKYKCDKADKITIRQYIIQDIKKHV